MNNLRELLMSDDPSARVREMIRSNDLRDFEPALANLKMDIPCGYHHKDNLEHSIRVLDNAIERETDGPDLLLRTAALLHDIGKPQSRKFEGKGVVTFRNHEGIGARMVKPIMRAHGYDKADIEPVGTVIALHMRGYGFGDVQWTDSAVRRLATDAGSDVNLDRLIKVFYSDLTTKNKRQKAHVTNAVARLEDALYVVREKDARKALRPAIDGNEIMELFGLTPGRELGQIMRFLNSDEGVLLDRAQALEAIRERFGDLIGR